MNITITKHAIYMLNLPLPFDFKLGFGTLQTLPRVILEIWVEKEKEIFRGLGEASIDFPFVGYDAWDIYYALQRVEYEGQELKVFREYEQGWEWICQKGLHFFPAAAAAFSMAVDDVLGQIDGKSISAYRGMYRSKGTALFSLPYTSSLDSLAQLVKEVSARGLIPKPKVGQGIVQDMETITTVLNTGIPKVVFDFNAVHEMKDAQKLVECVCASHPQGEIILEQPVVREGGCQNLITLQKKADSHQANVRLAADESLTSFEDAIQLTRAGVILNFKIQKLGGLWSTKLMEQMVRKSVGYLPHSFIGGTFPTALGRAYDQHCAAVLESAALPGDGWLPSTEWFTGDLNLIKEPFPLSDHGTFKPFDNPGLGAIVCGSHMKLCELSSPEHEYRNLRYGFPSLIRLILRGNKSYQEVYEEMSGRSIDWNL